MSGPELADLRGRSLRWLVSRRRPLLCAISSSLNGVGYIEQSLEDGAVRARLADVRWTIQHGLVRDVVAFENGPDAAVAYVWSGGYEAEIDGVVRYRLAPRPPSTPESRFPAAWTDGEGRHVVLCRAHRSNGRNESGELLVSEAATVEHVPVLVLLSVVHLTARGTKL